jgi:hypothetical protein
MKVDKKNLESKIEVLKIGSGSLMVSLPYSYSFLEKIKTIAVYHKSFVSYSNRSYFCFAKTSFMLGMLGESFKKMERTKQL